VLIMSNIAWLVICALHMSLHMSEPARTHTDQRNCCGGSSWGLGGRAPLLMRIYTMLLLGLLDMLGKQLGVGVLMLS
jgi:hypothetical protein